MSIIWMNDWVSSSAVHRHGKWGSHFTAFKHISIDQRKPPLNKVHSLMKTMPLSWKLCSVKLVNRPWVDCSSEDQGWTVSLDWMFLIKPNVAVQQTVDCLWERITSTSLHIKALNGESGNISPYKQKLGGALCPLCLQTLECLLVSATCLLNSL